MGFGAALLIAALLLSTYTKGKIAKIPLDVDATLVADGTGTAFDPASLSTDRFVINRNVPVALQEQISVESPSNAEVVTLQVGSTLRRTDKQQDAGLLLALVDTVTVNRRTATAVSSESNPGGAVQKPRAIDDTLPPTNIALPHDGLAYRFPFDIEKRTYPVFDPIAQKAYDANYDGEEDVNGLTTYKFSQNVGYDADGKLVEPVKYSSLYDDDADSTVTARAALWGLPGNPDEPITMTRYYAAQRTFWVDPVSGTILKEKDHGFHYYSRDALKPEVTFADFTLTSTEATVESQVAAAHAERDKLALWNRILPISFLALGLVAVISGGALAWYGLRSQAALIDPSLDESGHGFFGRRSTDTGPMPAAEAATEKLTRRSAAGPAGLIELRRLRLRHRAVPAYALGLALAVTAPLLAPGYLLLRDAVSTPRSYLSDAALGLSQAAPRALPQDFFLALVSHVVDGGIAVKALTICGAWFAGWGAARLAGSVLDTGLGGQLVAATVAIWNPYVAERLLQGHWSLLVGYGALPWVALSALRVGDFGVFKGAERPWTRPNLVFWIAVAGLTPTSLLLALVVALVCCRSWRVLAVTLAASLGSALPWLVATVVARSVLPVASAGVPAFAARAEPGLGTLGSLAGLGGIWNAAAVPVSRTTLYALVGTAVLLVVVGLGARRAWGVAAARQLLVLAVVAVVMPAILATAPGLAFLEWLIRLAPGTGVLRDGQKWVALAMPGYALAAAAAVVTLRRWLPSALAAAGCCVVVLAALPDLLWGVGGQLRSVHYPAGWYAVVAQINADPRPVAVLPTDVIRQFGWAGSAPVLDPLPRWVSADVLATGDLAINGRTVPGEGTRARTIQQMLLHNASAAELARAGVGWVVVEGHAPALSLPISHRDNDIALYWVGGATAPAAQRGWLIAAHLVWLGLLGSALAAMMFGARRTRGAAH
jgi:Porin PorA